MKTKSFLSQNTSWIIISFIALIALLALYAFSRAQKENARITANAVTESNSAANASPADSSDSLGLRAEENALYLSEQKPGNLIFVNFAILENGGYVVLHENKNEKPGTIIGSSEYMSHGEHQGFTIRLTRPVKSGDSFYAMLHGDDGDGIFNPTKDAPIHSSINSEPMMMIFDIDDNANPDIPVSL